jgi:hypothetical protein
LVLYVLFPKTGAEDVKDRKDLEDIEDEYPLA